MKILYVSGEDPRDTSFGSPQRNNRLWRALQEIGEVYAICLYPKEGKISDRLIAVKPVDRNKGWKRLANKVVNKFWFTLFPNARKYYPFAFEFSLDIKKEFALPLSFSFDIVVSRYIDPAVIFHLWNIAPLYVDIDDHPIQTLETRDKYEYPSWKRPLLSFLQKKIFHIVERNMTGGWIANPEQTSLVKAKNPILPLKNIPQYPSERYCPESDREPYIFSVGFMSYSPNYLGVDKFINEVWQSVHLKYPTLTYKIAGKGAPVEYVEKWNRIPGVEYLGYVADLEHLYEKALATVVPVDSGGGTCIKTLESLAFSRICLSRPFGVRGLEEEVVSMDKGLFVYETAFDFVSLFEKYIKDEIQRSESELQGYIYVSEKYSEESFFREVKSGFYND